MTKTAALGGGAKDRDVPKSQAIIAGAGGSVVSPEPTNTVASADAETGQTQSSISGRALFDGELNGTGSSARCLHGIHGPDDIRATDGDNACIRSLQVSPKVIVDLIIRPVFQPPKGSTAGISKRNTNKPKV